MMTNSSDKKPLTKAEARQRGLWLALWIVIGWASLFVAFNFNTGWILPLVLVVYFTWLSMYAWRGMDGFIDALNYTNLESFGLFGLILTVIICFLLGLILPPLALLYWIVRWASLPDQPGASQ